MKTIEILLVEDNLGDIRLTKDALKEGSVPNRVSVAKDGDEAIHYLKGLGGFAESARPDLILLDLNLPKKNGQQVLQEVKADPSLKTIPVVVLTSSSSQDDIANAYQHHANCYIRKPVDLESFTDVVHKIEDFWFTTVKLPTHTE